MPDTHTVNVGIPVEASVEAALEDADVRAMAGRLVFPPRQRARSGRPSRSSSRADRCF